MSSPDPVVRLTSLTVVQRKALDLAVRGKSDRQISQHLGISLTHVSHCLSAAKKKLGITGDGPRCLVHWWWTVGPGYSETRVAAVSDALRDMTQASNHIMAHYRKLVEKGQQL